MQNEADNDVAAASKWRRRQSRARTVIKPLTTRILRTWRQANIVWRGDSHYGRAEVMEWCDANGIGYIFGFPGNSALDAKVAEAADHLRFWHALSDAPK